MASFIKFFTVFTLLYFTPVYSLFKLFLIGICKRKKKLNDSNVDNVTD